MSNLKKHHIKFMWIKKKERRYGKCDLSKGHQFLSEMCIGFIESFFNSVFFFSLGEKGNNLRVCLVEYFKHFFFQFLNNITRILIHISPICISKKYKQYSQTSLRNGP